MNILTAPNEINDFLLIKGLSNTSSDFNKSKQTDEYFNQKTLKEHQEKQIGNYFLEKEIGSGGFAKVYLGTHILTNEKVAIKILNKILFKDDIINMKRFQKEIKILKLVKHFNIARLYEIIETPAKTYLIMEYCPNGELFDYILEHKFLDEITALNFFQQYINALIYLHSLRICHRDIKPENLLLDKYKKIKLIDFGISTLYPEKNFLNSPCGTIIYAPPEMHLNKKYSGILCDVWNCGIVLYAMVCGYLPFCEDDEDININNIINGNFDIPDNLSPYLKDLIKHCLDVDTKKRFDFEKIINHPWFNLNKFKLIKGINVFENIIPIDDAIINKCEKIYNGNKDIIFNSVRGNLFNEYSATYYIVLNKLVNIGYESISDLKSEKFLNFINNYNNIIDNNNETKENYTTNGNIKKRNNGNYINNNITTNSNRINSNSNLNTITNINSNRIIYDKSNKTINASSPFQKVINLNNKNFKSGNEFTNETKTPPKQQLNIGKNIYQRLRHYSLSINTKDENNKSISPFKITTNKLSNSTARKKRGNYNPIIYYNKYARNFSTINLNNSSNFIVISNYDRAIENKKLIKKLDHTIIKDRNASVFLKNLNYSVKRDNKYLNLKNFHKQNEKVKKNELSLNLSSFQYSTNTHEHHRTESYSPNAKIPIHNNLNEIRMKKQKKKLIENNKKNQNSVSKANFHPIKINKINKNIPNEKLYNNTLHTVNNNLDISPNAKINKKVYENTISTKNKKESFNTNININNNNLNTKNNKNHFSGVIDLSCIIAKPLNKIIECLIEKLNLNKISFLKVNMYKFHCSKNGIVFEIQINKMPNSNFENLYYFSFKNKSGNLRSKLGSLAKNLI